MTEKQVAEKLIDALLGAGCAISIDNGGDTLEVHASMDREELVASIGACDVENIIADREGTFTLVWGNDPDGSELIADHTDNNFCNQIYKKVYPND